MKKFLGPSLSLLALLASICLAGNWVPPPSGSSVDLMQRLAGTHWIGSGAKSSARIVYVFTDPNCPYCNELWTAIRSTRAPDVQVRYLLVAVIDADSRGKDAAIMESKDPAAALDRHERNFAGGGIAPQATPKSSTNESISVNEKLMENLHILGTPGLVYVDERGQVKIYSGLPARDQIRMMVGER